MEHRTAMGGNKIRFDAEFLDELVHSLTQESAIFAVKGHKVLGRHVLHLAAEGLAELLGIGVAAGAVYLVVPLAFLSAKGGAANVQAVYRRARHESYA